ncbi:HAD-IA family hydrolase [Corynebacterium suedekumii]|nr:HAD-IA family hydrolase [Corynebacterium suedekumii]
MRRAYTENPPVPLDGVEEALRTLRADGVKVGLTTGFSREIADLIFSAMGWRIGDQFDTTATGDEVAAGRPEPFMIQQVMATTGVTDPAQVISVGDTASDVVSAQRAGVTSVGVLTGHLDRETSSGSALTGCWTPPRTCPLSLPAPTDGDGTGSGVAG